MKRKTIATCLFIVTVLCGAQASEIWRNPTVFRINKEPAHAEFTIYADRADALKPLDLKNPWNSDSYQSLNGEWDFNWYGSVAEVPRDWNQLEMPVKEWAQMPVPGVWQSNGFDKLYYLNKFIPYEYNWETGERAEGFREGEIERSKALGFIPDSAQTVGCYRKWVDLPAEKLVGRTVLRIGAVEAGVEVYVNGTEVGYSQDSLTPAEFDISAWLTPGRNLIALKVFRWTDGSYMEVQDMIRFAGIYRDVFLKFEPQQSIRDIQFCGTPDKSLKKIAATYQVTLANTASTALKDAKVTFELVPNGSTKPVKTWDEKLASIESGAELVVRGDLTLKKLNLWSPDLPNLYTLVTSLIDSDGHTLQVTRIDTGFRRFEEINGNLHLNNKRFHIRGVNRHDHHPVYGRHVPVENMIRDLELMKQNNINTVRTSHYPNDERWGYLCNRYGMALIDEANVECHGFEDVPGNRPQWTAAAVDRIQNVVERDKNHPSVLIWSLGNEQGHGWSRAFDEQYDRAKEIDPSRLVMCDRGNRLSEKWKSENSVRLDKPDTVTPMYNVFKRTESYLANRDVDKRPFFMCEYRHAMGNSVGSLKEVWDHFYANEENGLNGGCIWDWIDQGVEARAEDGTVYYQYGGDWGDKESFGNFCLNGLVMSDQSWTPKLAEVKKCYEPFTMQAVSLDAGTVSVLNRLNQLSMDHFKTKWQLLEDGIPVQSGLLDVNAKPRETQTITVPFDRSLMTANHEYMLRVGFELKEDASWAPKGHEITFSEFALGGGTHYELATSASAPTVMQADGKLTVQAANGVSLVFNQTSGLLTSLRVNGHELLTSSDRDRLFDHSQAWIDNLFSLNRNLVKLPAYRKEGLNHIIRQGTAKVTVAEQNACVVVTVKNTFMSGQRGGFDEVQTWTINGFGEIEVQEFVTAAGKLTPSDWIARIGLRIPLKPEFENVSYYGQGPHGNYPDRCYGAWTGIHTAKVAENYVAYPRPQDHGNREKVRWMTISDAAGNGLKIIAPEPLSMSALPYTQDELEKAMHTIDLPKKSTTTELRIAAKVTGIGNGSCGPLTDEHYRTKAEPTQYRFFIVPITGK